MNKKQKRKYYPELAGRMYSFFISYSDKGAPSFHKFARSIGMTCRDIERFRSHKVFDEAYRECQEIRRDYLIDHALDRRFDSSFTKFMLTLEGEQVSDGEDELLLRLEVKD